MRSEKYKNVDVKYKNFILVAQCVAKLKKNTFFEGIKIFHQFSFDYFDSKDQFIQYPAAPHFGDDSEKIFVFNPLKG